MKYESANKKSGCLLYAAGNFYFRVYDEEGFKDYKILHSDLFVTINDVDAYFYEKPDGLVLDHSPQTLGISQYVRYAK